LVRVEESDLVADELDDDCEAEHGEQGDGGLLHGNSLNR
jgi:hypothetical protein